MIYISMWQSRCNYSFKSIKYSTIEYSMIQWAPDLVLGVKSEICSTKSGVVLNWDHYVRKLCSH
jgi:hypothetical protein